MIGFIGSSLQLEFIITAHTLNCFFKMPVWRISPKNHSLQCESRTHSNVESYITTDGQSTDLFCNKAHIWDLWPDVYYCQTVAGLLMYCLLFAIAAGPRQRNHSQVWVPWDSRLYFTVSDSRFHFSSPPTTRKTTVEIFHHAGHTDTHYIVAARTT
jgi:hypothetical protein